MVTEEYRKAYAVILAEGGQFGFPVRDAALLFGGYTLLEWSIAAIPSFLRTRIVVVGIESASAPPRSISDDKPLTKLSSVRAPAPDSNAVELVGFFADNDLFDDCDWLYLQSIYYPIIRPAAFLCLAEAFEKSRDSVLFFDCVQNNNGESESFTDSGLPALLKRSFLGEIRNILSRGPNCSTLEELWKRIGGRAIEPEIMKHYGVGVSELTRVTASELKAP